MPVYRTNYEGTRIELSHNQREGVYTLSIYKGKDRRTLSFAAQDIRGPTNINASDLRYFKDKNSTIRKAIRPFPHRAKIAVLSALESIL